MRRGDREHSRIIQLCPVSGEWYLVFALSFADDEPLPSHWSDLVARERIVAWSLEETWTSRHDFESVPSKDSHADGNDVCAVVAEGSSYGLITDMLVSDRHCSGRIGYFTIADLTDPQVQELISTCAREDIEAERTRRAQKKLSAPADV